MFLVVHLEVLVSRKGLEKRSILNLTFTSMFQDNVWQVLCCLATLMTQLDLPFVGWIKVNDWLRTLYHPPCKGDTSTSCGWKSRQPVADCSMTALDNVLCRVLSWSQCCLFWSILHAFCPAYKIHDLRALKGRTYTQKRVDFVHLKRIQRVGDRKSKQMIRFLKAKCWIL